MVCVIDVEIIILLHFYNNFIILVVLAFFAYNVKAGSQRAQACPVICPMIYMPVCARDQNGNSRTFPNDCTIAASECIEYKGNIFIQFINFYFFWNIKN